MAFAGYTGLAPGKVNNAHAVPLRRIVDERSAAARLRIIGVATHANNTQFIFLFFVGILAFHPAQGKKYSHSSCIF
jgi:hypothetical protein